MRQSGQNVRVFHMDEAVAGSSKVSRGRARGSRPRTDSVEDPPRDSVLRESPLTPPSVNLSTRLLPRTQYGRTLVRAPRRQSQLHHDGEQGDLLSCRRRTRETCAEPRQAQVMRGPGCARVSRPRTESTEGPPRFGTARGASPPALYARESASLATDATPRTRSSAHDVSAHLHYDGEQGDLRSRQRRRRKACAEPRQVQVVRGSPDPAHAADRRSRCLTSIA